MCRRYVGVLTTITRFSRCCFRMRTPHLSSSLRRASRRGVFELVAPRAAMLQPGDLIVVRTPGTFYHLFRRAAKHSVDHLAIVVENGMFLHVGPPTIRLLPVELLLTPNRRPLVFRPKLSEEELNQLLRSLKSLIGQQYDTVRVYSFVARLAAHAWFGKVFPLSLPKSLAAGGVHLKRESSDLVYSNASILPVASGEWVPKGEGTSLNPAAEALAQANKTRARSKRIATIGGRYEENIDGAAFMPGGAAAAAAAAAPTAAASSSYATPAPTPDDMLGFDPVGSVICTDAILPRLVNASAEWRAALGGTALAPSSVGDTNAASAASFASPFSGGVSLLRRKLDFFKLRSWSINDVFHFSALRPDLLRRIKLPPVDMPPEFQDLADREELDERGKRARKPANNANQGKDAANGGGTGGSPLAAVWSHPVWKQVESYLSAQHPDLHSRSVQLQQVLDQIYTSSSPLFRSMLQLYSYTMRNLPSQLQHAIRLYLLLMVIQKLMQLWRGYVLVRQGVRVTTGVVAKISGMGRRSKRSRAKGVDVHALHDAVTAAISKQIASGMLVAKTKGKKSKSKSVRSPSLDSVALQDAISTAIAEHLSLSKSKQNQSASAKSKKGKQGKVYLQALNNQIASEITEAVAASALVKQKTGCFARRRSASRSSSASSRSSSSASPSPSRVASLSALRRGQSSAADALTDMLARPQTAKVASMVADTVLPPPSARIVNELINAGAAAARSRKQEASSSSGAAVANNNEEDAVHSRSVVRALLSPSASTSFATPAAPVSAAAAGPSTASAPVAVASSGHKRAALAAFARSTASAAFPRLSRLVRLGQDVVEVNKLVQADAVAAAAKKEGATLAGVGLSDRSESAASASSSESSASDSDAAAPRPSPASASSFASSPSLPPVVAAAVAFAQKHPHLAGLVEQLQLMIVAAVTAQFVDHIRSAL